MERLPGFDGFVVRGVLTPAECAEWIARGAEAGFHESGPSHVFAGNRRRATVSSPELAARIWERVGRHIDPVVHDAGASRSSHSGPCKPSPGTYAPTHVSDFMRISEYGPGGDFSVHVDTCLATSDSEAGFHTVLLYLDGDFEGGETVFYDQGRRAAVTPEPGLAVVFYHFQAHAGAEVRSGCKHVVRSEVMFSKLAEA